MVARWNPDPLHYVDAPVQRAGRRLARNARADHREERRQRNLVTGRQADRLPARIVAVHRRRRREARSSLDPPRRRLWDGLATIALAGAAAGTCIEPEVGAQPARPAAVA